MCISRIRTLTFLSLVGRDHQRMGGESCFPWHLNMAAFVSKNVIIWPWNIRFILTEQCLLVGLMKTIGHLTLDKRKQTFITCSTSYNMERSDEVFTMFERASRFDLLDSHRNNYRIKEGTLLCCYYCWGVFNVMFTISRRFKLLCLAFSSLKRVTS